MSPNELEDTACMINKWVNQVIGNTIYISDGDMCSAN